MPKAREVAAELRRLADALDREPETAVQTAWLTFYCGSKEIFLNMARLIPRPFVRRCDEGGNGYDRLHLEYGGFSPGHPIHVDCSVLRTQISALVTPARAAVYECEPLLSDEELQEVRGE